VRRDSKGDVKASDAAETASAGSIGTFFSSHVPMSHIGT
jgi:hypothetical protein